LLKKVRSHVFSALLGSTLLTLFLIVQLSWALSSDAIHITSFGEVNIVPDTSSDFYSQFHTGFPAYVLGDSAWDSAMPFMKYVYSEAAFIINDDGSMTHTLYNPNDNAWIQHLFDIGKIPIIQNWITNFDTVSEAGLRAYFRNLSAFLGQRKVIWLPCYEFNGANWGDRGNGQSWNLDPTIFNTKMALMRNILDSEGITNILLGVHMNLLLSDPVSVFTDFISGMQKADILGASLYRVSYSLDDYWARAQAIYDLIGTGKPWVFFEYGVSWATTMTPAFVDASYQKLNSHPWVKGFIWYIDDASLTTGTMDAITSNAQAYEGGGGTPPPPE